MATIRDIVLRITGDGSDAKRELATLSRDLAAFGKQEADAEANVDTGEARAELDALEKLLDRIDNRRADASVRVEIAKALAEVALIREQINSLDREDVTIDVEFNRSLLDRMQGLGREAEKLASKLGEVEHSAEGAGNAAKGVGVNLGNVTLSGEKFLALVPALIAIVVSLGAAVVALAASLAEALGGLVALGVAAGGVFTVGLGLAIAAIKRYKEESGKAGTAAHALKTALGDLQGIFNPLLKAADPVLRAIARGLEGLPRVVKGIAPAFQSFGREAGRALTSVFKALTSPGWTRAIADLIRLSGPVLRPLALAFVRFGRILVNIARAAMPFLQRATQGLAGFLGDLARKTDDIAGLRRVIGEMVGNLSSWLHLLGAVARVFGQLIRIAAPFGKVIVDALARGADSLAKWLQSSEGTQRVQTFFRETLPLAKQLAGTFARIVVVLLQFGQFAAPILTPMVKGFNQLLDVLIQVDEFILRVTAKFRPLIGVVASLVLGFGKLRAAEGIVAALKAALYLLPAAFSLIGQGAGRLFAQIGRLTGLFGGAFRAAVSAAIGVLRGAKDAIVAAATGLFNGVKAGFNAARAGVIAVVRAILGSIMNSIHQRIEQAKTAGQAIFNGVKAGFNAARGAVVAAARAIVAAVLAAVRAVIDGARNAGQAIFNAVRAGFNAARGGVVSAARAIAGAAVDAVRAVVNGAGNAGQAIFNAVRGGFNAARGGVVEAARAIANGAIDAVRGLVNAAVNAGQALGNGIANGLRSAIGAITGIAHSIWNAINDALPDISIHIHIPMPSLPHIPGLMAGTAFWEGGQVIVGEQGPELVNLPRGSKVHPHQKTMQMLRDGGLGGAPAVGGGDVNVDKIVIPPSPSDGGFDPAVAAAMLTQRLKQLGGVGR